MNELSAAHRQVPLPLGFTAEPTLDNFLPGRNALAVELIRDICSAHGPIKVDGLNQIYLWGGTNAGKTHLLLAAVADTSARGLRSFYASLTDPSLQAQLCESLDGFHLVALDDIHRLKDRSESDRKDWEQALFNLINFCRDSNTVLLFGSVRAPVIQDWQLPDLLSRLAWGPVMQLHALNERECAMALLDAATQRGMVLDEKVVHYILAHQNRDLKALFALIDLLDRESIAAGREKITVPFVKRCLQK